MEYYNFMSYSMQATPYFNQKIPLGRIAQNGAFSEAKVSEYTQSNRNHITWEDAPIHQPQQKTLKSSNQSSNKSQRRRIFDKFQSRLDNPPRKKSQSRSKQKQSGKLMKVKSHPMIAFHQIQSGVQPDVRIQQINRQLKQHRLNLTSSRVSPYDQTFRTPKQQAINWAKIEQKLSQSKQILQRQQQILATKIPTFQKKIEDNNAAISQVTRLIKFKLENESKKMDDLYLMMEKNGERVKNREEELSRINSELLQKESQIMRNKEINKRRQLELKRIKRIEDLQNKNLEIYQQIQKKDAFSKLQDVPVECEEGRCEEQCWGECESGQKMSKMSVNKISTIQYSQGKGNSFDENDTIGELLSPLALIEQSYLI